jgi:hypothetical protein
VGRVGNEVEQAARLRSEEDKHKHEVKGIEQSLPKSKEANPKRRNREENVMKAWIAPFGVAPRQGLGREHMYYCMLDLQAAGIVYKTHIGGASLVPGSASYPTCY